MPCEARNKDMSLWSVKKWVSLEWAHEEDSLFLYSQSEYIAQGWEHYQESHKEKKMIVDFKAVNFKIMTTSFKRTRNVLWKKIKAMGGYGRVVWEKLYCIVCNVFLNVLWCVSPFPYTSWMKCAWRALWITYSQRTFL